MNSQAAPQAEPAVGFLVKTFPKLSETFILGEILGLERLGLKLELFALQRPTDARHHAAVEAVQAKVRYLPEWRWLPPLGLWRDQLRLWRRSPRRFREAIRFVRERPESGGWRDWLSACWLACRMLDAGVPHLHSHFINRPTGIAEIVNRLTGIGYSISAHAKDIYLSEAGVLRRKLQGARFCVTCTGYNRDHLQEIAGAGTEVHRLYHGINLNRFRPVESAADAGERPPLLLSVGRYREKKGFTTLIHACALLRDQGRDFRCQIVGYGPDYLQLQAQIDALLLSRHVQLVEPLAHEQLIERYGRASLFVLPSLIARDGDRDGIPNVLLEAMAMELPVISTRVSGIPEVVGHEQTGLLVEPDAPAELAAAMARILDDGELARGLGRNARRFVTEYFSPDANLRPLVRMLRESHAGVAADAGPAIIDGNRSYA